jgi:hypothetical protein
MQCYVFVNCGAAPDQLMLLTPHMMKLLLVSTDFVKNMTFKRSQKTNKNCWPALQSV